jgi:hypothetical protein
VALFLYIEPIVWYNCGKLTLELPKEVRHSEEQIKMFNRIADRRGGVGTDRPPRKVKCTISSINIQWIRVGRVPIGIRLAEIRDRYRKIEIFLQSITRPIGELELAKDFLNQWYISNRCEIGEKLYPVSTFDFYNKLKKLIR